MIVIQLSDRHILAPGELLYRRFDAAQFLARAVAEINRLDPLPDVAVVTGDLVDHGEPPEYEHLRALLEPLAMPVFVMYGPFPECKIESGLDGHVFGLLLPESGRARMGSA